MDYTDEVSNGAGYPGDEEFDVGQVIDTSNSMFSEDVTNLIITHCHGRVESDIEPEDTVNSVASQVAECEVLHKFFKKMCGDGSDFKHNRDQLKMRLSRLLQQEGLQKVTTDAGTFTDKPRLLSSIPAENLAIAYEWFRDNGYGGIIKETIHSKTLEATMREILAVGKEVPECVNIYFKPFVNVRLAVKTVI